MKTKTNLILNQVLQEIKPNKAEFKEIDLLVKGFLAKIKKRIKTSKTDAEIFVGGSFAKNTVIRKNNYDLDIFLRFGKKHQENEISKLTKKLLKGIKNVSTIHGSRDYFRVAVKKDLFFELIPVRRVKNPKESSNITDLSYSHVKYINKKIKSEKVLDEIRLAKAFCYANHCYGAESYIHGFSGYALELLVYYYGSFEKFIKAMAKVNLKDKLIIDIEKHHKNKKDVLMDLNASKLHSPIILIDPTYKQRNALAALSSETLVKFQKDCKKFLKTPSINSFKLKKTDLDGMKKQAKKNKNEFLLIEIKTSKREGDVAGSKLLKFYQHLNEEIKKVFIIKNQGFDYNQNKSAICFFVVKKKKEIIMDGPFIKDKQNLKKFKRKHKKTFTKEKRVYAKKQIKFNLEKFVNFWSNKNKPKIKEMAITGLKIIHL